MVLIVINENNDQVVEVGCTQLKAGYSELEIITYTTEIPSFLQFFRAWTPMVFWIPSEVWKSGILDFKDKVKIWDGIIEHDEIECASFLEEDEVEQEVSFTDQITNFINWATEVLEDEFTEIPIKSAINEYYI